MDDVARGRLMVLAFLSGAVDKKAAAERVTLAIFHPDQLCQRRWTPAIILHMEIPTTLHCCYSCISFFQYYQSQNLKPKLLLSIYIFSLSICPLASPGCDLGNFEDRDAMEPPKDKMPYFNRPGWSRFGGSLLIQPLLIPAALVATTTFLCYLVTPRQPRQVSDK